MDFAQKLSAAAGLTEEWLDRLLADQAGPRRLVSAMRHGSLAGGKRFRPFLVLESAALFDVPADAAMAAAGALECMHCYSLIHDDLPAMDNDDLRRGRPTVHRAFDDWTAILAGDGLLTLAFEVLARPGTHPDAAVRAELALALAQAAGPAGMVGGQCLDLAASKLGEPAHPTVADVLHLQAMKTGALIRFACEAGAILGRAGAAERQALARFGDRLGLMFQITDDLLDVAGTPEKAGKAVGKDADARKATLVSLLGEPAARDKLGKAQVDALSALDLFGARAHILREAVAFLLQRDN